MNIYMYYEHFFDRLHRKHKILPPININFRELIFQ